MAATLSTGADMRPTLVLQITNARKEESEFLVNTAPVFFGRDAKKLAAQASKVDGAQSCPVADGSMSGVHMKIFYANRDKMFYVEDVGSRHGTELAAPVHAGNVRNFNQIPANKPHGLTRMACLKAGETTLLVKSITGIAVQTEPTMVKQPCKELLVKPVVGGNVGRSLLLQPGMEATIGRLTAESVDHDKNLWLEDPTKTISRVHAILRADKDSTFCVKDVSSAGTWMLKSDGEGVPKPEDDDVAEKLQAAPGWKKLVKSDFGEVGPNDYLRCGKEVIVAFCYGPAPGKPDPPTKVHASGDTVKLAWNAPESITKILLYMVQMSKDGSTFENIYAGDEMECEAKGLSPGTTYYFQVVARNQGGESPVSDSATIATA